MEDKHIEKVNANTVKQLNMLNERQWLFISLIRKGATVPDAYKASGYDGKSESAPYMLMQRLKKVAELLSELGSFNRLTFMNELDRLVSLPLAHTKKDVTLSEKLRTLKLLKTSLPDMQEAPRQQFTQIIIQRHNGPPPALNVKDAAEVIEAEVDADAEPAQGA